MKHAVPSVHETKTNWRVTGLHACRSANRFIDQPRRYALQGCAGIATQAFPYILATILVLRAAAPAFGQAPLHPATPAAQAPAAQPSLTIQNPFTDEGSELKNAESEISNGNLTTAIANLNPYVMAHPDSARAHYDLGFAYFRAHQLGNSIRELSKSLELNPQNSQAHKILGLDCSTVGRYDLAEVELQQAANLEPDSAEIHYLLGRLYYTREVYPLARKEFQSALKLDTNYMKAYASLGLVMEIFGNNEEAVKNYQAAVRLNEQQNLKWAWPYEYLSAYYNRQEQLHQAIAYAHKAIAINPNFDLAYFQIARANQNAGHWPECEAAARKAIDLNPRTPDYYYVLSFALRKEGKVQDSETALQTFEKLHQNQQTESEHWKKAREQALQAASSRSDKP